MSRTVAATAGRSRLQRRRNFPLLQRPLVDRLRVSVGEGVGGAANLVSRAPAPHPLFILALCSRGPLTIKGGPIRKEINSNILPLDLTLYFNLKPFFFNCSITD